MKTKTIQVFSFDELSKDVQRKVVNKISENMDFSFIYQEALDCLYDFLGLFDVAKKDIRLSVGDPDYCYATITNDNLKYWNKKRVNQLTDNTGVCYGIDLVDNLKLMFNSTGNLRVSLVFALDNLSENLKLEYQFYYSLENIREYINNNDLDFLENGIEV